MPSFYQVYLPGNVFNLESNLETIPSVQQFSALIGATEG